MSDNKPVKQVLIFRRDLEYGTRGKQIAQGAHGAMAFLTLRMRKEFFPGNDRLFHAGVQVTEPEWLWITGSFRKVVVQVPGLRELMEVHEAAEEAGLEARLITDNGLTVFHGVPTVTCLALGPDFDERLDPITGGLELY
jgi:PTH2 family peptidyl-tRNA hydrolase